MTWFDIIFLSIIGLILLADVIATWQFRRDVEQVNRDLDEKRKRI